MLIPRPASAWYTGAMPAGSIRIAFWTMGAVALGAAAFLALGGYFGREARVLVPARATGAAGPPALAVVFWSGDMGLRIGFGSDLVERLAQRGIPVLTVSSPVLFGTARDIGFARRAMARSLTEALRRTGARQAVLIGFSFGADMVSATAGTLAPALRQKLAGVVLVGPGADVHFHANPFGLFYLGKADADPRVSLARLRGVAVSCVFGSEESDSLCRDPALRGAALAGVPGGHLMLGHRAELVDAVEAAVIHPPEPLR
jgi:type IV secretory pathway VirJ component